MLQCSIHTYALFAMLVRQFVLDTIVGKLNHHLLKTKAYLDNIHIRINLIKSIL